MEAFKQYLETPNTLKLGDNAALTPYFALPYVKKVESHPVFKELLQVRNFAIYFILILMQNGMCSE